MSGISERIKVCRKKAELTQEQLSSKVGVTKSAISQWESGDATKTSGIYLAAAASALNVDLNWLITGKVNYTDACRTDDPTQMQVRERPQELYTETEDERIILEKYRAMTFNQRMHMQDIINTFPTPKKIALEK